MLQYSAEPCARVDAMIGPRRRVAIDQHAPVVIARIGLAHMGRVRSKKYYISGLSDHGNGFMARWINQWGGVLDRAFIVPASEPNSPPVLAARNEFDGTACFIHCIDDQNRLHVTASLTDVLPRAAALITVFDVLVPVKSDPISRPLKVSLIENLCEAFGP